MSHSGWSAIAPAQTPLTFDGVVSLGHALTGKRFQELLYGELAVALGAASVLLTDSGTSALRIAMSSFSGVHNRVALPAFGCFDLITALQGAGLRGVLYDISPYDLTPDMESLDRALMHGVDSFVVVSFYGHPLPMAQLAARAALHNAALITDLAQSGGAHYRSMSQGNCGDAVTLSFGRGKGLGGAGGGAVAFRSHVRSVALPTTGKIEVIQKVASLMAQQLLSHPLLFRIPSSIPWLHLGENLYHEPRDPSAIASTQAALALTALKNREHSRNQRSKKAALLMSMLSGSELAPVDPMASGEPGWLRFPVFMRHELLQELERFGARPAYSPQLSVHPEMKPLLDYPDEYPGATVLASSLATLPTHERLIAERLEAIARVVKGAQQR